jgi:hypothetical protein
LAAANDDRSKSVAIHPFVEPVDVDSIGSATALYCFQLHCWLRRSAVFL